MQHGFPKSLVLDKTAFALNTLDLILCLPLAYGLVRGLLRGFVQELTSIAAVLLAVILSRLYAPDLSQHLRIAFNVSSATASALCYAGVFLAVVLLGKLVAKLMHRTLRKIHLGWIDTVMGATFDTVKWAMIVSIVLNILVALSAYMEIIRPEVKAGSALYEPLLNIAASAKDALQGIPDHPVIPAIGQ